MLLYQKTIDRSSLKEGFQIPVEFHPFLMALPGGLPKRGNSINIKIVIDGIAYDAQLKNQQFDEKKYFNHPDVVQIRYNPNSAIAKRLREVFSASWEYVERQKNLPENINRKIVIRVPEEQQEYLVINSTGIANVFVADYITTQEKKLIKTEVQQMSELDFETFEPKIDTNAHIKEVPRIQRIRQLDRSIGDSLKKLYDYRCQMTGERIGEAYDVFCAEAHHIIPFSESLNNDYSNIIILSPTYHRIVHKACPTFDKDTKSFRYPNGLIEEVKLNKHL